MSSSFDYVSKINALMERAMHPATPEGERQACLAKAEALRARFKIDESQLQAAGQKTNDDFYEDEWKVQSNIEFWGDLNNIQSSILSHFNVRRLYDGGKHKVFGHKSDIQQALMMYTVVYMEMARHLFPRWDPLATFDDNVYRFVRAGYKWAMIHAAHKEADPATAPEKLSGRYKAGYVRQCKALGEEPASHTQRHAAFRASYGKSFASTIRNRLYAMRQKADEEAGGSLLPALQDDEERVNRAYYARYPQFSPEARAKRAAEEAERQRVRWEAMTDAERDAEYARQARETEANNKWWAKEQVRQARQHDAAGWRHGAKVANNVDLSGGNGHIAPNREEIC